MLFSPILLNWLFAMSGIELVTARMAPLQKLVDQGNRSAAAAVELGQDRTRFLSTIQIGITSIGVLNDTTLEKVPATLKHYIKTSPSTNDGRNK